MLRWQEGGAECDHREGFALLEAACGWSNEGIDPSEDAPARAASDEVARWVRAHFPRLEAALERLHPDHVDLFAGIEAPEGDAAMVLALSTLLCRLDEIQRRDVPGAARPDGTTMSSDGAAVLETLARRGIDHRERLGACVDAAKAASAPRGEGPAHDARENELVALYRWHADWAATARTVIARKDLLVLMGLAGRRRGRVTGEVQRKEDGGAGEG